MRAVLAILIGVATGFAEVIPPLPPEVRAEISVAPAELGVDTLKVNAVPTDLNFASLQWRGEAFVIPVFDLRSWSPTNEEALIYAAELQLKLELPPVFSAMSPVGIAVNRGDAEKARELLHKYRARGK